VLRSEVIRYYDGVKSQVLWGNVCKGLTAMRPSLAHILSHTFRNVCERGVFVDSHYFVIFFSEISYIRQRERALSQSFG